MITTSLTAPVPVADQRSRELTDAEHAAVLAVGAATFGLALIGFANSFAAVSAAARPSFGGLAATVPLGIDLGIAIFAALDIVLARLDMRPKWVRLVPWALTLATVYLNVAGQHSWFARIAHAMFPCLWVLAVEAGVHVIRTRARLQSAVAMDRIRPSRWLLAPVTTAALWRRMVLWEIRSYPDALTRERDRVLARTALVDAYGWRWRQTAPRRARALYRLGQHDPGHAPATPADAVTVAAPAPASCPWPRPAPVLTATAPAIAPDSGAATARPARRAPAKPGTATAVARLAASRPDLTTADIARRLKVSDRTVRRYLAPARALTAAAPDADLAA